MIAEMECPECKGKDGKGNKWIIWGEPFESQGSLVILTAECIECEYKIVLGIVDANDMAERDSFDFDAPRET